MTEIKKERPALIILDVMMPRKTGYQLCEELKKSEETKGIVILLLTAVAEAVTSTNYTHWEGKSNLADDYIPKPFYMDELIARIQAVLRRTSGENLSILRAGDLTVNLIAREVSRGKEELVLPPREFSLLEYLMRNAGAVVTRTMISEHVWDIDFDTSTNVIDVYINYLRNKIDVDFDKKLIQTIRGRGYTLKD